MRACVCACVRVCVSVCACVFIQKRAYQGTLLRAFLFTNFFIYIPYSSATLPIFPSHASFVIKLLLNVIFEPSYVSVCLNRLNRMFVLWSVKRRTGHVVNQRLRNVLVPWVCGSHLTFVY